MARPLIVLFAVLVGAVALVALTGCASEADAAPGTRVEISANGQFSPQVVTVKAGVPVELSYTQGTGCTTGVRIPELGVAQDLSDGPAVVRLPSVAAGEYEIYCVHNVPMGTLVAR